MYTTINEELRIQSCSIADLNPEQFAEPLEDPDTITIIYDPVTDMVILNSDNKYYELYEIAATTFLMVDEKKRFELMEATNDLMAETNELLDKVARRREWTKREQEADRQVLEWKRILGEQPAGMYFRHLDTLKAFKRMEERSDCLRDYNVFMYGFIQGIRAERAKRKKVSHE